MKTAHQQNFCIEKAYEKTRTKRKVFGIFAFWRNMETYLCGFKDAEQAQVFAQTYLVKALDKPVG